MRAKKQDIPIAFQDGKSYSRDVDWGDINVAWEGWAAGMDATPMFKGLPDDRCQYPHWGLHDEIINAGEVYYRSYTRHRRG